VSEKRSDYLSYLLRLWRVSGGGEPHSMGEKAIWRASLKSTRTGERRGFASLDELFDFLREQTGEWVPQTEEEQPDHASYMLRLWREGDGEGGTTWRASLESARTGELTTFAGLAELFDYLREQTGMG
jgi:hypothetical protein